MKILYVFNDIENKESYRKILSEISEPYSVFFLHSLNELKDFIQNSLIQLQEEIDCIICDSDLSNNKATPKDATDALQISDSYTYSNRDFKIKSIPILLTIKDSLDITTAKTFKYTDVIKLNSVDDFRIINDHIKTAIKDWRTKLLGELDDLSIRFNSGKIDIRKYDLKKKGSRHTDILSENFKLLPRKLKYNWIETNNRQLEKGIDKLIKILKQYERNSSLREENRIQNLFKEYPYLLKRDFFNEQIHEPHFYDPRQQEEDKKPDFLLKPSLTIYTDLSVLEVKLPNELFLKKRKHIKNFYSSIWDYICQISDYKEYLEGDEYQEYIFKTLREVPSSIHYNLLIGRLKDKENAMYHINKRFKQFNINPDLLLTYDELLELQLSFLDRFKLLNVQ